MLKIFGIAAAVMTVSVLQCEAAVESVSASVTADEHIPPTVRARMESSVKNIAEQVLLAKSDEELQENSAKYEKIIYDVFDKVLVGYSMDRVSIAEDGTEAKVSMKLKPWQDTVKKVDVTVTADGMPPFVEQMILADMQGIDEVFDDSLLGLPLGAADWSNGVLKQNVSKFMESHLPEFRADFDVAAEEEAKVKVTVYPLLPVVRTMDLQMRSDTFPSITLITLRRKMQREAHGLLGVPVKFVERHQADLERHYAELLDNTDGFKHYRVSTNVHIKPGENMTLMSRSNTPKLRVRGESWTDVGHHHNGSSNDARYVGHVGWQFSPDDEVYSLTECYPQNMSWVFHAGYSHQLLKNFWVGLQYDFTEGDSETEIRYDITRKWSVRHEYRHYDNESEWGLRYRIHDFLGFEWVRNKDANWLRVIGTF